MCRMVVSESWRENRSIGLMDKAGAYGNWRSRSQVVDGCFESRAKVVLSSDGRPKSHLEKTRPLVLHRGRRFVLSAGLCHSIASDHPIGPELARPRHARQAQNSRRVLHDELESASWRPAALDFFSRAYLYCVVVQRLTALYAV